MSLARVGWTEEKKSENAEPSKSSIFLVVKDQGYLLLYNENQNSTEPVTAALQSKNFNQFLEDSESSTRRPLKSILKKSPTRGPLKSILKKSPKKEEASPKQSDEEKVDNTPFLVTSNNTKTQADLEKTNSMFQQFERENKDSSFKKEPETKKNEILSALTALFKLDTTETDEISLDSDFKKEFEKAKQTIIADLKNDINTPEEALIMAKESYLLAINIEGVVEDLKNCPSYYPFSVYEPLFPCAITHKIGGFHARVQSCIKSSRLSKVFCGLIGAAVGVAVAVGILLGAMVGVTAGPVVAGAAIGVGAGLWCSKWLARRNHPLTSLEEEAEKINCNLKVARLPSFYNNLRSS